LLKGSSDRSELNFSFDYADHSSIIYKAVGKPTVHEAIRSAIRRNTELTDMIDFDSRPSLAPDLRVSTHSDGAVILDIREGQVFSTNKVGARILAFVAENTTLKEIADRIAAEFDTPQDRVRTDLSTFIDSLRGRGLVRV
jgi:hypothetical protein